MARRSNTNTRFPMKFHAASQGSLRERRSVAWSSAEDNILIEQRRLSTAWKVIAEEFVRNKSSNACRKRHERLIKDEAMMLAANNVDQRKLGMVYCKQREAIWSAIAKECGISDWKVAESMAFKWGLSALNVFHRQARKEEDEFHKNNDYSQAIGPGTPPYSDYDSVGSPDNGFDKIPMTMGQVAYRSPPTHDLPPNVQRPFFPPPQQHYASTIQRESHSPAVSQEASSRPRYDELQQQYYSQPGYSAQMQSPPVAAPHNHSQMQTHAYHQHSPMEHQQRATLRLPQVQPLQHHHSFMNGYPEHVQSAQVHSIQPQPPQVGPTQSPYLQQLPPIMMDCDSNNSKPHAGSIRSVTGTTQPLHHESGPSNQMATVY